MAAVLRHSLRRKLSTFIALQQAAGKVAVQGPSAVSGGHDGGFKLWRNMTLLVAFPAIALCAINCVMAHNEHEGHHRPEFVKYDYMRVRTKRFPWGDGNRSLFHNKHANALPDGYEE